MEEKLIVSIVRSRRRTMSLEIGRDLKVIVRVPLGASRREIEAFVHSKEDWIREHFRSTFFPDALPTLRLWWASPTDGSQSGTRRPAGAAAPLREI